MKAFAMAVAMGAAALAGCGGGGSSSSSGGGTATPAAAPTVTISASNQASVTRAAIEGGQAFGQSQPFAAANGAAAQAVGSGPAALRASLLRAVVQRGLVAAFGSHHDVGIASATRPAATSSSTDACAIAGSITTTLGDADNSQSLTSGDTLAFTFNHCRDSSTDAVDGVMTFTIGSVTSGVGSNVQFSGTLAFSQLNATSGTNQSAIQGSVGVSAAITSTSFQISLTVGANALLVTSSAPGYLDTIVYDPGMQLTVSANEGTVTVTDVTLDGSFTASSIGGRIAVTTVVPLRQLGTDTDPSSGQIVITGASGTRLRVTAQSGTSVQLDLDGNGDGTYEGSGVFAWSALG